MELFDEDLKVNEKTDNKRITTIIMVVIIFLIIMVLIVVGLMIYIKETTLTINLNSKESSDIKNMIIIDENNPQDVLVPIRKIAKILGYEDYSGSYTTKSEEFNECYVQNEFEVAMFSLNSKTIYKTLLDGSTDFEYFRISDEVKAINGELYTTIEGIEKAFNVSWDYDVNNKKMEIYTMPYLINGYSQSIVNYGYESISDDFNNQKAVLDDLLVVNKGKNVGVLEVTANGIETVLEPKYEEIVYLEHTGDFLVTADTKKGIIAKNKRTIIKLQYDDISLMDYDKKLYSVKIGNKYGIIDYYGKKIIDAEYDEIGIDISKFPENDIRSKYILADSLIPVKLDKLWAFFDYRGNQITDFKYDNIGYVTSNNKVGSGYSLLVVPEYNVIIVEKDKKYNVITTMGQEIWPEFFFTSIYMQMFGGQTNYILEIDSQTYNLTEQLDGLGYGKNNKNNNENQKSQNNDEQNGKNNNNQEIEQNQDNNQNNDQNNNQENNDQENDNQNNNSQENEQNNNENNNNEENEQQESNNENNN